MIHTARRGTHGCAGRVLITFAALGMSASPVSGQFYVPDRRVHGSPADHKLAHKEVAFESADGARLHGWFLPARGEARGTVVHFHGNAQNITAHLAFVAWLPARGLNLFMFDYRGYGRSEGTPTREGVFADGVAALRHVSGRDDVDASRLLVLGQSLGGANAVAVLATHRFPGVRGLVVDSAFYTYREIARDRAPPGAGSAVASLVDDAHSPGPLIDRLAPLPLVIIHGKRDTVVPYEHALRLYGRARGPKQLWPDRRGDHLVALARPSSGFRRRLLRFFDACLKDATTSPDRNAASPPAAEASPSPMKRTPDDTSAEDGPPEAGHDG